MSWSLPLLMLKRMSNQLEFYSRWQRCHWAVIIRPPVPSPPRYWRPEPGRVGDARRWNLRNTSEIFFPEWKFWIPSSDLRESPPSILTKVFPFGCKLLCFRVILRGWECSHSIRSEILNRYWYPDFFRFFWLIFQILTFGSQIVIDFGPIVAKKYYFLLEKWKV